MTAGRWAALALAAVALVLAAAFAGPELARALRLAFLLASAGPIGAVLLLVIGRLTGADWSAFAPLAAPLPVLAPVAALAMLGAVSPPPHLALYAHPLFAAARAFIVVAALAWVARRAARRQGAAAGVLAVYAALVTPVAADWMLGAVPGHPVSAIGMMLFVQQVTVACALLLIGRRGSERMRGDMAKLLIAAALGLCYLGFVDFLIIWYGNLPERVPFYIARTSFPTAALALAGLLLGLAGPIAALALMHGERGQRVAGGAALAGVALFDWWWLGGGLVTGLGAALALVAVLTLMLGTTRWRTARG